MLPKKGGPKKKKFLQDVSSMMFPRDFNLSNSSIYLAVATTDCNCRETFMGPPSLPFNSSLAHSSLSAL